MHAFPATAWIPRSLPGRVVQIRHPRCIRFYGTTEDPATHRVYLVMELIEVRSRSSVQLTCACMKVCGP